MCQSHLLADRHDHNAAIGLLTLGVGGHLVVVPQGKVDDAALVGAHGMHAHFGAALHGPMSGTLRQTLDLLILAGLISLDVDRSGELEAQLGIEQEVEH